MNKKRYVAHISGQGKKWEVMEEEPLIYQSYDRGILLILPKSEYAICDPPENVWRDVTGECKCLDEKNQCALLHEGKILETNNGYRLRKVSITPRKWAFIVEQKVEE